MAVVNANLTFSTSTQSLLHPGPATGLATGALAASALAANVTGNAAGATGRIIDGPAIGRLYFDTDGNQTGSARVLFATTSAGLAVTNADFFVARGRAAMKGPGQGARPCRSALPWLAR